MRKELFRSTAIPTTLQELPRQSLKDLFRICAYTPSQEDKKPEPRNLSASYKLASLVDDILHSTYGTAADQIQVCCDDSETKGGITLFLEPKAGIEQGDMSPARKKVILKGIEARINHFLSLMEEIPNPTRGQAIKEENSLYAPSKIDMLDYLTNAVLPSLPDQSLLDVSKLELLIPESRKKDAADFYRENERERIKDTYVQIKADPNFLDKLLESSFSMPFTSIAAYLSHANFAQSQINSDHFKISIKIGKIRQAIINEDNLRETHFHFTNDHPNVSLSIN
ncbi:MAG: hypothetical protein DI586_00180 [Micavibrio aeruginosavorus]|uniref:Uncharacterized protein n=1 Tax=Micavibrio aeruginosavorus TaxID=349221 RepID=A0A2W5FUI0_9BACT|nr:MAG: hypothetical protein DI586_00180 [Micavibrio aeruginosavorus]